MPHLQGLTEFVLSDSSTISDRDLGSLSELSSLGPLHLKRQFELRQACCTLSCLTLLTRLGITSSVLLDEYLTGLQVCYPSLKSVC